MKNTWGPTDHLYTYEEKREALIDLVREAVMEREMPRPGYKSALAGNAFDATDCQTHHLDALVDALSRTDALTVLGRIFAEEVSPMSIIDKLPTAPEGTYWKTTLSVLKGKPKIWLTLETDTWHPYHFKNFGFADPDEESISALAQDILDTRENAIAEGTERDLAYEQAKPLYAHLLTED